MSAPTRFRAEQELYRSHRTIVELGTRDGRRLVVKRSVDPSSITAHRRAAHEARLLQLVRSEHVIAWAGDDETLDPSARNAELVLEHVEGKTLAELPAPLPLDQFYRVASDACRALAAVHDAQIIHKDVNPSNFVLMPSGRTKLIDFDIATRCTREDRRFRAPAQIDGTLLFIAPEQTGRTNRPLDLRADLYSLGATFYWLLSGKPPFEEGDPLALLHKHIAEQPRPLGQVPPALDRIVQRLLAKNAEDRYQSARGVERDLARARDGTLTELGTDDVPYRLVLPVRILGRQSEARALCESFEAMQRDGRCRVTFVAGFSGIGKTALVREVHKPLVSVAGYFLQGKFNPFDRNTPYAGLSLALEGHVRVLLGETVEQVESTRQRLRGALGERAGTLVAGFPVLEPLLGSAASGASAASAASVASAQADPQAMGRLLQRLFGALATPQRPLVIFFDDLQWADTATLAFIERTAQAAQSILIVGAYRDNEVGAAHPLRELIARLGSALTTHLTLRPLARPEVAAFVSETLHRPLADVAPLADTLLQRTGGNPFFLGQTLLELEHEEVLALRAGVWSWDQARLAAVAPTEHVADITAQRIAKAAPEIRELLFVTACIGNEIEVAQLKPVLGMSSVEIERHLERALYDGFFTQLEPGRLAFLHDRVRLAAYEQRDPAARRAQHRRVAEVLLESSEGKGRRLFETVAQLTAAVDLEHPAREPISSALVELSLAAANRAHHSGAFDAASGYARSCRSVLGALGDREGSDYRTATSLYGDAQYSLGNFEEAQRAYDELLALETDPIQRSAIYRQKAVAKTVEGQLEEAFGYFPVLVRELGFDFNTLPTAEEANGMVEWARDTLGEFGLEELEQLPRNDESLSGVLIDACLYFGTIAYAFRPESFRALQSYTLIHCFDWGVPPSAPPMITAWAYCAASVRDYPLALEVARAGCRLAERHSPPAIAERARTLYAILAMHYASGGDEHLLELRACADRCAAHGDLEYAGYARTDHDTIMVLTHGAGSQVAERVASSRVWASELHVLPVIRSTARIEAHLAMLRGADAEHVASTLANDVELHAGDEASAEARDRALRVAQAVLCGEYREAVRHYTRFAAASSQVEGSFVLTLVSFFGAVALRVDARRAALGAAQLELLEGAEALVRAHALQNARASGAYLRVLEALAQEGDVVSAFETAIDRARSDAKPVVSALAAALAAERCQQLGNTRVAHSFAEQAAREYAELGVHAAVRALQVRLADVGLRPGAPGALGAQVGFEVDGTATGVDPRSLDLWSALRASQALAAELRVEPLIARLLGLAREAAGAQRAVLVAHAAPPGGGERVLSVVAELQSEHALRSSSPGGDRESHSPIQYAQEPLAKSTRVPVPLIERALRAGEARVVHDAARDAEWADLPYFRASSVRSALCVPIGQGANASVLYLENSLTAAAFNPSRIEVLRILASQAAISLQNARLVAEEAEKDRLHQELETAARIQRALVPTAPEIGGFAIAVHMTPADQVGGDYYDVLRAGGCDWFVVGDVCGHGLPAGLIMVICQTALHAVLQGQPDIDPAQALSQINRVLKANLERFHETKYVAITLFRHLGDGLVEYAGLHEDVLIYRSDSGEVEVHPTSGTWLGIVPEILPLIPVRQVRLAPGDVLALYTDGVIDARASDGSLWGGANLQRLLRDCGALPLETIKDRILATLANYRQTDDITLFLARRKG